MVYELTKIARKLYKLGKSKEAEQLLDMAEQVGYNVGVAQGSDDEDDDVDLYDVFKKLSTEEIAETLLDNLDEDQLFDLIKIIKDNIY
jgi:hypothetical protein